MSAGAILSSLVVADGLDYVGSTDDNLYALISRLRTARPRAQVV